MDWNADISGKYSRLLTIDAGSLSWKETLVADHYTVEVVPIIPRLAALS
jgi:hypothetical protein